VQISGHDPPCVETSPSKPLPEIAGSLFHCRTHRITELHGDEETHQAIIRLTRSSAACVD
jgi:hypothetical protein